MDLNLNLKYAYNEVVEMQLLFNIKRKAHAVYNHPSIMIDLSTYLSYLHNIQNGIENINFTNGDAYYFQIMQTSAIPFNR